jgi:hypothetical protein
MNLNMNVFSLEAALLHLLIPTVSNTDMLSHHISKTYVKHFMLINYKHCDGSEL